MGATSVTGVGPGSAEAGVKGPGNGRNIYVPQVSPHVLAAGSGVLAGGALTVTFPSALAGSESGYVVMLTTDAAVAAVAAKTDDADGNFASFDIAGTGTDSVMWMVVNAGNA
jgi:hypothetical protein